ncbi:hypothetical protein Pcinc_030663 [Petrolisthes cinctipes]|uniref:Uncharacterized protein n=1 Tax=Petrolisthes cinctipes TaxID=88211 RepID=A0AAE1K289_PETCI|nr:hypothetical protein Pcinc_030663 [Petrolisthes cinctipes]
MPGSPPHLVTATTTTTPVKNSPGPHKDLPSGPPPPRLLAAANDVERPKGETFAGRCIGKRVRLGWGDLLIGTTHNTSSCPSLAQACH